MLPLLLLLGLASASERIVITNMEPRETRSKEFVHTAGGSFVNTRVPSKCGWGDSPLCFMYITLQHGGNCSLPPARPPAYGECGADEGRLLTYVTSDLSSGYWGEAVEVLPLPARPRGAYARPHMAFNPLTRTFVLWVSHRAPAAAPGDAGALLVATCAGAACPDEAFTVVTEAATLPAPTSGAGAALLVDEADGSAYLAHCLAPAAGGGLVVQRLSADWTAVAGASAGAAGGAAAAAGADAAAPASSSAVLRLPPPHAPHDCVAPAMFKRRGVYYVLFTAPCRYCPEGAATHAFASPSPLGPFAPAGNLGNVARAQLDGVVAHGDVEHVLWMGTAWGVGHGGLDYAPAHWALLQFYAEGEAAALPRIRPIVFLENFATVVHTP
jgi:hypothetical protein